MNRSDTLHVTTPLAALQGFPTVLIFKAFCFMLSEEKSLRTIDRWPLIWAMAFNAANS